MRPSAENLRDPSPLWMFLTPSLNKFFDTSTPSLRKVDDRETKEKKKRKLRDVQQEREVAIFK